MQGKPVLSDVSDACFYLFRRMRVCLQFHPQAITISSLPPQFTSPFRRISPLLPLYDQMKFTD